MVSRHSPYNRPAAGSAAAASSDRHEKLSISSSQVKGPIIRISTENDNGPEYRDTKRQCLFKSSHLHPSNAASLWLATEIVVEEGVCSHTKSTSSHLTVNPKKRCWSARPADGSDPNPKRTLTEVLRSQFAEPSLSLLEYVRIFPRSGLFRFGDSSTALHFTRFEPSCNLKAESIATLLAAQSPSGTEPGPFSVCMSAPVENSQSSPAQQERIKEPAVASNIPIGHDAASEIETSSRTHPTKVDVQHHSVNDADREEFPTLPGTPPWDQRSPEPYTPIRQITRADILVSTPGSILRKAMPKETPRIAEPKEWNHLSLDNLHLFDRREVLNDLNKALSFQNGMRMPGQVERQRAGVCGIVVSSKTLCDEMVRTKLLKESHFDFSIYKEVSYKSMNEAWVNLLYLEVIDRLTWEGTAPTDTETDIRTALQSQNEAMWNFTGMSVEAAKSLDLRSYGINTKPAGITDLWRDRVSEILSFVDSHRLYLSSMKDRSVSNRGVWERRDMMNYQRFLADSPLEIASAEDPNSPYFQIHMSMQRERAKAERDLLNDKKHRTGRRKSVSFSPEVRCVTFDIYSGETVEPTVRALLDRDEPRPKDIPLLRKNREPAELLAVEKIYEGPTAEIDKRFDIVAPLMMQALRLQVLATVRKLRRVTRVLPGRTEQEY